MMALVAASMGQGESLVAIADAGEIGRQVMKVSGDKVDHVAFTLDAAVDAKHAAAQDDAAVLLEDLWPEDEVGDTGLLLGW
jgi:hypothetical protein